MRVVFYHRFNRTCKCDQSLSWGWSFVNGFCQTCKCDHRTLNVVFHLGYCRTCKCIQSLWCVHKIWCRYLLWNHWIIFVMGVGWWVVFWSCQLKETNAVFTHGGRMLWVLGLWVVDRCLYARICANCIGMRDQQLRVHCGSGELFWWQGIAI